MSIHGERTYLVVALPPPLAGFLIVIIGFRSVDLFWSTLCVYLTAGLQDLPRKLNWGGNMNFGTGNAQNGHANASASPPIL